MERFRKKRLDRVGSSLGHKGHEVATLYTPSAVMAEVLCCAPVSAEAINLMKEALLKFKRIEMSHAEFIDEVESILREYDELTAAV